MTPLVLGLGVPELLIILAVVLLLFGGARLAGLGKSTGRALREFKEETKGLKSEESQPQPPSPASSSNAPAAIDYQQPPQANTPLQPPNGASYQQPPRANQDPSGTDRRNDA
ncbi:MAG TPA: twin-arginine translocase TatA/TatE family subunit [Propionibacteriaceae bacterium]|jgi:sec-independent protein translocase protein TatA|nr:twin-arginine translocase TatA/TatE family subunit [Propionibacteriaceae bacterium]